MARTNDPYANNSPASGLGNLGGSMGKNAVFSQSGGGGFGNMFGGGAGGGSFMGMGGGGSSGTPWGLLAALTAQGQLMGDRQPQGSILSKFQEGALPSPGKSFGLTPGSEGNFGEGMIASFLPFLNFFREPDIKGKEDADIFNNPGSLFG